MQSTQHISTFFDHGNAKIIPEAHASQEHLKPSEGTVVMNNQDLNQPLFSALTNLFLRGSVVSSCVKKWVMHRDLHSEARNLLEKKHHHLNKYLSEIDWASNHISFTKFPKSNVWKFSCTFNKNLVPLLWKQPGLTNGYWKQPNKQAGWTYTFLLSFQLEGLLSIYYFSFQASTTTPLSKNNHLACVAGSDDSHNVSTPAAGKTSDACLDTGIQCSVI